MNFLDTFVTIGDMQIAIVDLVALGILVLFFIIGIARGFLKQIASLLGPILSGAISVYACKPLAGVITEKMPAVPEWISGKVSAWLGTVVNVNSVDEAIEQINNLNIPLFLKNSIISLVQEKGTEFVENFSEGVISTITTWAVIVIAFVAIFILCLIVFGIIKGAINKLKEAKTVNSIDRLLGAALGVVKGFVIIFVLYSILSLIPSLAEFLNGGENGCYMTKVMSYVVENIIKVYVQ